MENSESLLLAGSEREDYGPERSPWLVRLDDSSKEEEMVTEGNKELSCGDDGELILGEDGRFGASIDSGINGSISPTGSQTSQPESVAQAFNGELCVMTPRMSPVGCSSESSFGGETDNLVEEVYVAKHSINKGLIYANQIEAYMSKVPTNVPVLEGCKEREKSGMRAEDADKNNLVEKVVVNVENDRKQKKVDNFDVVVSIDIGTTYSGYAFAYIRNQSDKQIHMMRQSDGGDRGLNNQKVPTVLLLTPDEKFHSFGFAARDYYHDLDPQESKEWLYFDKFKMKLHNNMDVNRESQITALNGKNVSALHVFSHTLGYMKNHIQKEMSDQGSCPSIRWVITVPALWTQQAKQFIREAAYMAEICSSETSDHLLIALEPEAASICCRHLHFDQIVQIEKGLVKSGSYMVVDCGGGTVDITVHSVSAQTGTLRELHKATGGPCGSIGKILSRIGFGHCLSMCFAFYALRMSLIAAIPSPWWIIPIEMFMQGPTYALCYTTVVAYASAVAPPGTSGTIQGIVAGVDDGLGFSIGSIVGGIIYKIYGGRMLFIITSVVALTCCLAHSVLFNLYFKHSLDKPSNSTPLKTSHTTHIEASECETAKFVPDRNNEVTIIH
uniref:MFS_1_like domain-containing protein n=1 Tax=Rhodnius prolixus TaxID=13249 RepID=T1HGA0_RHOPR